MNDDASRFWAIFLEVFEALPRQGPGNRACAARALSHCHDLPPAPEVLDLGCGVGAQTMHLAALTEGTITAVDSHGPNIDRLGETAAAAGLTHRITPLAADMAALGLEPARFDLVWSEGALYNLGLPKALPLCRDLLKPGGYLCFSEPVWRTDNPPQSVRDAFAEYPGMGFVAEALAAIGDASLEVSAHFTLPDEAWWDDFYTPMEHRIAALRAHYSDDPEALAMLDKVAAEPVMYREHGNTFAYEFFVVRRPG